MEGRENCGGFMIARIYAEMVAALSDEQAGRILRGLVYEFWGCGEKADVSANPLVSALYNSIAQTAKEIDDNYQAQRERKREAGRKGGLAKKAKSGSDKAELSSAKECLSGAKPNKSKVKENKENKSNESKESKASAPSAVLTTEQRNLLIDKYGKSAAETYEDKFERWKAAKKAFNGDAFTTISKWIEEDKPKRKSGGVQSSFDVEEIERAVFEKYKKLE